MSVLVYTENWDGKFKKLSYELVSYASRVAEMTGGTVTALSIGNVEDDELGKLGNFGASTVLSSGGPGALDNQLHTGIIAAAAEKIQASYKGMRTRKNVKKDKVEVPETDELTEDEMDGMADALARNLVGYIDPDPTCIQP